MVEGQLVHLLPFILLFYIINVDEVFQAKEYLSASRKPAWLDPDQPNVGPRHAQPEQVHLAYHGPDRMVVSWVTGSDPGPCLVQFGPGEDFGARNVSAQSTWFFANVFHAIHVHHAELDGIEPGQVYTYRVGNQYGWSNLFHFKGVQERPEGGHRVAVYGDFGSTNARSLGTLVDWAQSGNIDFVMHVGDFAYNLDFHGDAFMRMIEPIASRVPYMVSPGNHEIEIIPYHNYVYRFNMPESADNHYYSYDLGKIHILSFSTEFYYDLYSGVFLKKVQKQFDFIKQDLEKANQNRGRVPWIVTLGHRPMYCSTDDLDDCRNFEDRVRTGPMGLERLFYDAGVDLEVWAHEHTYERLFPTFQQRVYNGSQSPNVDPQAPVHVISGSAGCNEFTDHFIQKPEGWSAFRSQNYGFSVMQAHNATHLHWQQIRASDGAVEDDMWLVQHEHGPRTSRHRARFLANSRPLDFSFKERRAASKSNKTPKRRPYMGDDL